MDIKKIVREEIAKKLKEAKAKLNEASSQGYIESMGPDFDEGVDKIVKAWEAWEQGPSTTDSDKRKAVKDVLTYIEDRLSILPVYEEKTENKARKQLSKSNIDDLADLILKLRDIQKSFAKNKDEGVVTKIGSATRILDSVMDTFGKYIEPSKKPIGEEKLESYIKKYKKLK